MEIYKLKGRIYFKSLNAGSNPVLTTNNNIKQMKDLKKTIDTIDEIIAQHEKMKNVLAEIHASLDEQHEIVQECLKNESNSQVAEW